MSEQNWQDKHRLQNMIECGLHGKEDRLHRWSSLVELAVKASGSTAEARHVFAAFLVGSLDSLQCVNFSDSQPMLGVAKVACKAAEAEYFLGLCRQRADMHAQTYLARENVARYARIAQWPYQLPDNQFSGPARTGESWTWAWYKDRAITDEIIESRPPQSFIRALHDRELRQNVLSGFVKACNLGLIHAEPMACKVLYWEITRQFSDKFWTNPINPQYFAHLLSTDELHQYDALGCFWALKMLGKQWVPSRHEKHRDFWQKGFLEALSTRLGTGNIVEDANRCRQTSDPVERHALFRPYNDNHTLSASDPFGPYVPRFNVLAGISASPPVPTYEQCVDYIKTHPRD